MSEDENKDAGVIEIEEAIKKYGLKKKTPKINWGPDFEDKSDLEKVVFLKKFANSFNHALALMQNERNDLLVENNHLKNQVLQLQASKQGQNTLYLQAIREQNEIKDIYQKKIDQLQAKINELKREDE